MTWCRTYGGKMYTVNPTNVDELCDYARPTGIAGLYRRAQTHVLNQKGIAAIHAKKLGKGYEDLNLIVCHVDGGITVTAHSHGRMIDSTEGAGGDGPFTPPAWAPSPLWRCCNTWTRGIPPLKCGPMLSRSGGFVSHFGTSDASKVHALVEAGDPKATTIWNTVIYQLCKSIGGMAAVLEGKVDGILLTGGLMRYDDILRGVEQRCGWIAPVSVYPRRMRAGGYGRCGSRRAAGRGEGQYLYRQAGVFGLPLGAGGVNALQLPEIPDFLPGSGAAVFL